MTRIKLICRSQHSLLPQRTQPDCGAGTSAVSPNHEVIPFRSHWCVFIRLLQREKVPKSFVCSLSFSFILLTLSCHLGFFPSIWNYWIRCLHSLISLSPNKKKNHTQSKTQRTKKNKEKTHPKSKQQNASSSFPLSKNQDSVWILILHFPLPWRHGESSPLRLLSVQFHSILF